MIGIDTLAGRQYMGKTLKAALVSDLNSGMIKPQAKEYGNEFERTSSKKNDQFSSKMAIDNPSAASKGSILDRIKRR